MATFELINNGAGDLAQRLGASCRNTVSPIDQTIALCNCGNEIWTITGDFQIIDRGFDMHTGAYEVALAVGNTVLAHVWRNDLHDHEDWRATEYDLTSEPPVLYRSAPTEPYLDELTLDYYERLSTR